jgi:hypothetical protein
MQIVRQENRQTKTDIPTDRQKCKQERLPPRQTDRKSLTVAFEI